MKSASWTGPGFTDESCLAMIETLISLIIMLLIIGLIWWAATAILGAIPVPEPIKTVINVVLIVLLCLVVIYYALIPLMHAIPRIR